MTRSLLVDTNRAAYPIYQALYSLGHEVWVVGGKPSEPLAKLSPNYVQLDYADSARLAAFVEGKGFDHLVPGCTDVSYRVCAEIDNGRFSGIETPANVSAINTKSEFRKLAISLGLSVPRVLPLERALDVSAVIVKPVDSFSGRGMAVIQSPNKNSLNAAYDAACKASNTGTAIVEEFVAGQLFSHSAFVRDQKIVADFIVREDCTTNPFTVDTSRVIDDFPLEMLSSLREDVCKLTLALQLKDGLVHSQFIVSGEKYWIIEVTRRCPGDIYALLIELSTGYPYGMAYAAPFVGLEAPVPKPYAERERIIRHTVTSQDGESLWGFRLACPVEIRLFVPLATSGEFIAASPYGRAGIFFFRTASADDEKVLYQKLLERELYSLK